MATIPSLTTSILAVFGSAVPTTPSLARPPSGLPAGETSGFPVAGSSTLPSFFGPQFTGSGTVLTDHCATAEYTLIDDAPTAYYVPFLGCMDSRPECCPFNAQTPAAAGAYPQPVNANSAILASCPVDYVQVSGSCCPNAFTPWTAALGGQTPCYSTLTADATLPTVTTAGPANATGRTSSRGFSTSRGGNLAASATASGTGPTVTVSDTLFAMQYAVETNGGGGGMSGPIAAAIVCSGLAGVVLGAGALYLWKRHKNARGQIQRQEDAEVRVLGPPTPPPGPAELPAIPAPQSNGQPAPQQQQEDSRRRSWVSRGFGHVRLLPPSTVPLPQAPTERPYFRPIPARSTPPILPELPADGVDINVSGQPNHTAFPPPSESLAGATTTIQPPQAAHLPVPPLPRLPRRPRTTASTSTTGATTGTTPTTSSSSASSSSPFSASSSAAGGTASTACTDESCMCLAALNHRASVLRYQADVLAHQASVLSHHHQPENYHRQQQRQHHQRQLLRQGGDGLVEKAGRVGRVKQGQEWHRQRRRRRRQRQRLVQPVELEAGPVRRVEGEKREEGVREGRGEGHGAEREEEQPGGEKEGHGAELKEEQRGG